MERPQFGTLALTPNPLAMPSPADADSRRSGSHPITDRRRSLESVPAIGDPVLGAFRGRPILAALCVYTVLVTTWLALGAPGADPGSWIRRVAPLMGALIATLFAWRAGGELAFDRGTRLFWKAVAGAVAVFPLGHVIFDRMVRPVSPSTADLAGMAASMGAEIVMLLALLYLPSAPRTMVDRVKLSLDIGAVSVAGLLVIWYGRWTIEGSGIASYPFTILLAQATLDLIVLVVMSVLWRRTVLQYRARVLVLLGIALLVQFAVHVLAIVQLTQGIADTDVVDLAAPVYFVVIAAAAWASLAKVRHRQLRVRREKEHLITISLPFAAVLAGFALLLDLAVSYDHDTGGARPLLGVVLGVVVLTALVLARQFASTKDAVRGLAESTARNNEARFQALVQHSSDVIMVLDPDGIIRYASPSMSLVFGHDPAKLVTSSIEAILHPEDVEASLQFLEELARSARASTGGRASGVMKREWRIRHADGEWMTVDNVGTNLLSEPVIRGLVLNTRDVTEQSMIKQQYMHQAFHDPLTDLANRSLFLYQVGQALSRAPRQSNIVTVLFLDLDNFKTVNDSLGHAAGDRLLVEAARRLTVCVRESDLIARLGGDEFAVLVEDAASVDEVLAIAERIGAALSRPFVLGAKEVFVNASVGISRSTRGEGTDELVRNADVAMYVAKMRGKAQHALFEPAMHKAALDRLVVEADLRRAIELEEFVLQYQPIVELASGDIIGAEALVRWTCRDRGRVLPGVFIPIAEETGLIVAIGRWVLREACRQAKRWTDERGLPVRISVNLSGRQLQEPGIVDEVRQALAESGLAPGQLVLELTESMLMHNTEQAMARLNALKELGVSLALDDFGTGYSSLSYLQRYPIDILKIDKAFVDVIAQGGDGPVLASAIVALGETLRMNTVAEGIETEAQRGHLLTLGCELGQGYLFAPPLDADGFWHLLLARGARTPSALLRRRDIGAQAA